MPQTSIEYFDIAVFVTARITAFNPGQSPPPVITAIVLIFLCAIINYRLTQIPQKIKHFIFPHWQHQIVIARSPDKNRDDEAISILRLSQPKPLDVISPFTLFTPLSLYPISTSAFDRKKACFSFQFNDIMPF
jgi:hypothetical protein